MNRIGHIIGIGIVLAMLTLPAMAGPNTVYFIPQHPSADPGNTTYVEIWLNLTDPHGVYSEYACGSLGANVTFDPSIADITDVSRISGDPWDLSWSKCRFGSKSWWIVPEMDPWEDPTEPFGLEPGIYPIANLTIEGVSPGEMDLHFSRETPRKSDLFDAVGVVYPTQIWVDGTFTCGDIQTHTMLLLEGWNLISPPLTPTDNSVDTVLSGVTQNAVDQYNATSKQFEAATTMDPGVGYFVHVTDPSGSTWSYQGSPVSSTNPGLKLGLNMIGVPNCAIDVGTAMGLADYRYVARWNAATQEYEVHNPVAPSVFHGFTEMTAGEGYFVSAKSDGSLTIDC